jgi:hypothetical protein
MQHGTDTPLPAHIAASGRATKMGEPTNLLKGPLELDWDRGNREEATMFGTEVVLTLLLARLVLPVCLLLLIGAMARRSDLGNGIR